MKYSEQKANGKFVTVMCNKCKNVQTIYGKATTLVKCINCKAVLAEPRSSKAKIKAKVIKIK
jgi:ribosomal protein S27E